MPPTHINPLPSADGSATHTALSITVLTSINGPLEVSRRDEDPEAATIDVNLRTPTGPGSPRDRCLEDVLLRLLEWVVLIRQLPRTLVQVTVQILEVRREERLPRMVRESTLLMLPALIRSVQLALLAANLPCRGTVCVRLVGKGDGGREPFLVDLDTEDAMAELMKKASTCSALHLFVFGIAGRKVDIVTQISEGDFSLEDWEAACELAGESLEQSLDGDMEVDNKRIGDGDALLKALKG